MRSCILDKSFVFVYTASSVFVEQQNRLFPPPNRDLLEEARNLTLFWSCSGEKIVKSGV